MAAKSGEMNWDVTSSATPQTTGEMIIKVQSAASFMQISEPASVSGLMKITSDSGTGAGFMQITVNS